MALTYQMDYSKNLRRNLISVGAAILLLAPCALPWKNYSTLRLISSIASAAIFGCVGLKEADKRTKEEELELLNWDNYVVAYQNQQIARLEQDAVLIDDQPQALISAGEGETQSNTSHPVITALANFGVSASLLGEIKSPSFTRLKIQLNKGVGFTAIEKKGKDLKISCSYEYEPFISAQPGYVAIDIPRPDREFCAYEDYAQLLSTDIKNITIPSGVDINGKLVEINLCDPNSPHFLVAGTTGGGKTEWMITGIFSLLDRFSPEYLHQILIDPKLVSFSMFDGVPGVSFIDNIPEALEKLSWLVEEMESRYILFSESGVKDISEYYANPNSSPIPHIVVFFDEFYDFVADKKDKEDFELRIKKLASKARGAGIHLGLGTQRPEANVITPLIRANIPARIALRTKDPADGKIILGHECNSSQLFGKGDLFYGCVGDDQRLQGLYIKNPQQLLEKAKSKLSTNHASPAFTAKPVEASLEPPVKPTPKSSTPILSRNEYVVKLLGEALAQLPNKPEIPLFDSHYDLSIEEKLLVVRSLLYKKIGKENAIFVLWGRASGGKNHHLYQACSECFEAMKNKLREQGFNEMNEWGFK